MYTNFELLRQLFYYYYQRKTLCTRVKNGEVIFIFRRDGWMYIEMKWDAHT
jgi:hypothetical protein